MVRRYPIRSENIVAHIRKATQGRVALENTHPFVRELWGRYWVFAHNGDLKDFHPRLHGARPNVTADAAAICVKSGNAVILRGGKEAAHSSRAIVEISAASGREVGLPADAVAIGRHRRSRGGRAFPAACRSSSTWPFPAAAKG